MIRTQSGIIETIVGDGPPGDGPDGVQLRCRLNRPHGVFVDAKGNVYIGDSSNNSAQLGGRPIGCVQVSREREHRGYVTRIGEFIINGAS